MDNTESVYLEAARKLIREHGYLEARQLCIQWRDMNSPGTISFMFHNVTLKHIERAATVGKLDD
jgi:hypothetical protein